MRDYVIVGSAAAKHWYPEFRIPNDIDIITKAEVKPERPFEVKFAPPFQWLLDNTDGQYASSDALYTIKLSHIQWLIHWDKSAHDLAFFQSKGCKLIEPFYEQLYAFWKTYHPAKKVNLNKTNDEFFNKNVPRKYDHDYVHSRVMYHDEPYYNKLKHDKSRAWIAKDLFDALPLEEKLKACREEIYVIALERFLIPNDFKFPVHIAYRRAVKDLVTRMSTGWFPKCIMENWNTLQNWDHSLKFKKIIEDGKL